MKNGFSALIFAAIRRRPKVSAMLCAIAAFGAFAVAVLGSLEARQEAALERTREETVISCSMTDVTGSRTDKLKVMSAYVDILLGLRHERGCYLDEYVKDVCAKAIIPLDEPESLELCRILNLRSDSRLSAVEGCYVSFYDGWGEEALSTTGRLCLVPENMVTTQEPEGEFVTVVCANDEFSMRLQVIGRISGGPAQTIFCPFRMQKREGISDSFPLDSCSFAIADNAALAEAKAAFWDSGYFVEPSIENSPRLQKCGILVKDTAYRNTLHQFESNLRMLGILLPALCVLAGVIGFLASYFAVRGRLRELAIMRCMGLTRNKVTAMVFLEQTLLAIPGSAIGFLAGAFWNGNLPASSAIFGGMLPALFLLGCLAAALTLSGKNPMGIMKTED